MKKLRNILFIFILTGSSVFGQDILCDQDSISREEFNSKALTVVDDLGKYINIVSDKNSHWKDVKSAIDLACDLFTSEDAEVEVSFKGRSEHTIYKIRTYLERMKLLKYDKVDISWSDIRFVSKLRKGDDGLYYGIVSIQQRFTGYRDNRIIYKDVTEKHLEIVLKPHTKSINGEEMVLCDVYLGNMGVEITE